MDSSNVTLDDDYLMQNDKIEIQLTGPGESRFNDFGYNASDYTVTTIICFDYLKYSQCHRINQQMYGTSVDSFKDKSSTRTRDDWLEILNDRYGNGQSAGTYDNLGYFYVSSWDKLYLYDYQNEVKRGRNDGEGLLRITI